jgi:hypothetical protein
MPKKKPAKETMPKKKPAKCAIVTPTPELLKKKLAQLDALRRKVKAAAGMSKPAKKPKRPRFTGSWGCGG